MGKIAEGIIDKLSIIGFFNVIISGGVFLYGISPILDRYAPGLFYAKLGLEKDLEKAIVACLLCYIFGSVLKCLQLLFFGGMKTGVVNRCMNGMRKAKNGMQEDIISSNKYQRQDIFALASKLFEDRNLGKFNPKDKEMCQYFFEYCKLSNSINGFGNRAFQLSESAAFYQQVAIAFFSLVLIGILLSVFTNNNALPYCIGYLALGVVFLSRAYHCLMNWAGTVLATYEVLADNGAEKKKQ